MLLDSAGKRKSNSHRRESNQPSAYRHSHSHRRTGIDKKNQYQRRELDHYFGCLSAKSHSSTSLWEGIHLLIRRLVESIPNHVHPSANDCPEGDSPCLMKPLRKSLNDRGIFVQERLSDGCSLYR
jgi:hypothetical protein